jgi:hypothetical protein
MQDRFLFIASLMAALFACAPTTFAQATDLISSINGDSGFESDNQMRYFNREDCGLDEGGGVGGAGGAGGTGGMAGAGGLGGIGGMGGAGGLGGMGGVGGFPSLLPKRDPSETTFEIRLQTSGSSVSQAWLWVGGENSQCNLVANRDTTANRCGEVAGNPQSVGNNSLLTGLTLQDLLDATSGGTEIVTCDSSGLEGTPYQIFVFRNQAPGSMDVDAANYGIADFLIDVEPPAAPLINTTPQRQSNFNITWGDPDPPDLIQRWAFFFSDVDDPSTAQMLSTTAPLNERSQSFSASSLGLGDGDTGYIFMTAFDQAFVSDQLGGNESELSPSVMVTNVPVTGFCDATGDCSGCSASRMNLAAGEGPVTLLWMLALLLGLACTRRLCR